MFEIVAALTYSRLPSGLPVYDSPPHSKKLADGRRFVGRSATVTKEYTLLNQAGKTRPVKGIETEEEPGIMMVWVRST